MLDKTLDLLDGYAEILKSGLPADSATRIAAPAAPERIHWVRSHHDLIELISSLHAQGAFAFERGGVPGFTALMRQVCNDWGIQVGDIFVKRRQIFDRINESTPFLDKLKSALLELIDERLK